MAGIGVDLDDTYAAGVDSEQIGAVVITPQSALDKIELINTNMAQLNGLIGANPKVRPEFKSTWEGFYSAWQKFYADNGPGFSGWTSRLWASTYEQALDYEKKLAGWYDAVQKEGVPVNNPGAPDAPDNFPWKWVLIGGGLLLGYVLVKEVGKGVGDAVGAVGKKVAQ